MSSEFFISLKLADRSNFPLFRPGEWGEKTLNLSAAQDSQEKVELLFYLESGEDEPVLLTEISINKDQVPGDEWKDLQLKMDLSRDEGFIIAIISEGDQLDVRQVNLPVFDEDESYSKELETQQKQRGSLGFALISGIVFCALSLAASFFVGRALSSFPPPELSTKTFQETTVDPIR